MSFVDWSAVAALGTWAAVLVALFLPMWQARKQLNIRVNLSYSLIAVGSKLPSLSCVYVSCTNAGTFDVVICNWCFMVGRGSKAVYLQSIVLNSVYKQALFPDMPYRLRSLDSFGCGMPRDKLRDKLMSELEAGHVRSDDCLTVCFVDSTNRKYKKRLGVTVQQCIDDMGSK